MFPALDKIVQHQRAKGVLPMPESRAKEIAKAMNGGVHHSHLPSWGVAGKLSTSFGNKRGEKDPGINADKAADLAAAYGYHVTR